MASSGLTTPPCGVPVPRHKAAVPQHSPAFSASARCRATPTEKSARGSNAPAAGHQACPPAVPPTSRSPAAPHSDGAPGFDADTQIEGWRSDGCRSRQRRAEMPIDFDSTLGSSVDFTRRPPASPRMRSGRCRARRRQTASRRERWLQTPRRAPRSACRSAPRGRRRRA